jgi:RNA polymerase sigma-70 factor (ECF subfamily)
MSTPATESEGKQPSTPLSLLERARESDQDAWRDLVALYRPLVLFWCGQGGVPAGDGEDVSQEVFACVHRDLAGFRKERPGDTFRGWLRVVTRNQVLLYFRRNKGRIVAEGGSGAYGRLQGVPDVLAGPAEGEAPELRRLYQRAIDRVRCEFEENTWLAFWLTAIEQRLSAAVADELGMSTVAIRQARSRVLRRIKEELGELLE